MILRAIGMLLAAALLVAGIHAASLRGLADAYYTSARLTVSKGTAENSVPRPEALTAALASMHQALALEPSNPHFVEQSARLQEMRAISLPQRDAAARDGLRQSLAQFREAALMRPGSAQVWASIAMLKVRLNELDAEFYAALERAGRLGPWEPQAQIAMVDVGLATWKWLTRPGRELSLGALDRALLRQEPEVRRIAAVHGNLPQVCAEALDRSPRITALCVRK